MSAFLITGNPGSGKTTLGQELSRRGLIAVDADETAHWETTSGEPVSQPEHASDEWLLGHRWVWSRPRIEDVIRPYVAAGRHIFLCGIAMNQRDMLDLFTTVFLLSIDHETQLRRLDAPANADRNAAQRAQILEGRATFEREMRAEGAVVLDGSRPTSDLVSHIHHEVSVTHGWG
jgi:ABC-type phosphonate transport system ATPase subunit